jgi:antitoxin MazE
MISKIRKWGNSLGIRIPKSLAEDARVAEGTPVDIRVENGRLVIARQTPEHVELDDLLDRVTPENLHGAVDTGPPVGREVW